MSSVDAKITQSSGAWVSYPFLPIIFIDPNNEIIQINDFVIGSAGGITHKLEIDKTKIFISGNKYIDKMVLEMIENDIR